MVNKQDYLNAFEQNIDMVRGDTLVFNFTLKGLGSQSAYEDLEVEFNASDSITNAPSIIADTDDGISLEEYDVTKDVALFSVSLSPDKTKEMDLMRYYYNLQIKDDDNVVTLMRGRLTLLYEID